MRILSMYTNTCNAHILMQGVRHLLFHNMCSGVFKGSFSGFVSYFNFHRHVSLACNWPSPYYSLNFTLYITPYDLL